MDREREEDRKTELLSMGSLPKCLQLPGWTRAKPGPQNSIWTSPMGHCLLSPRCTGRGLDWKPRRRDSSRHSDMGGGSAGWRCNLQRHSIHPIFGRCTALPVLESLHRDLVEELPAVS